MAGRGSYKTTLFDRLGPDAAFQIRATTYGLVAAVVAIPLTIGLAMMLGLKGKAFIVTTIMSPPVLGWLIRAMVLVGTEASGRAVEVVMQGTGSSTPYTEQYSYQQTLVMQGRLNEALDSYEAIIAEPGSAVDVRIRAAELYTREAKNHQRAAELLQDVLRHPSCTPGEEVYAANRLADLLSTYLNQPGKALVQLRRIADRYAGTPVGDRAREAIRTLKALTQGQNESAPGPTVGME